MNIKIILSSILLIILTVFLSLDYLAKFGFTVFILLALFYTFLNLLSSNKLKFYWNLETIIDSLDLGDDATISSDPRGVILEIDGDICFPSLSSDLDLQFIDLLKEVTAQVMSHPYDKRTVIIEGHSDSDPIRPDQRYHKNAAVKAIEVWRTNRHLSSARASEVVEFLVDSLNINAGRLVAAGYGEFWPYGASWNDVKSGIVNASYIANANKTVDQRNKNRRVKIIFSKN